MQGKLVPKLTLGPFLTLSVRNGPNIERLKFAAAYWVPSTGAEATGGK